MKLKLKKGESETAFSVGNHHAEFKPGKVVEVADESFANYCVAQGNVEVVEEKSSDNKKETATE